MKFNANMKEHGIDGEIGDYFAAIILPENLCGELAMGIPCIERLDTKTTNVKKNDTGLLIAGHQRDVPLQGQPCTQPSGGSGDEDGRCYFTRLNDTNAHAVLVDEVRCFIMAFRQYHYVGKGRVWRRFMAMWGE